MVYETRSYPLVGKKIAGRLVGDTPTIISSARRCGAKFNPSIRRWPNREVYGLAEVPFEENAVGDSDGV